MKRETLTETDMKKICDALSVLSQFARHDDRGYMILSIAASPPTYNPDDFVVFRTLEVNDVSLGQMKTGVEEA